MNPRGADLVFGVANHHVPSCGKPPRPSSPDDGGCYRGYFEGEGGDQWIYDHRRGEATGTLRGGDLDWREAYPVERGRARGLLLGAAEGAWLMACWRAATAVPVSTAGAWG